MLPTDTNDVRAAARRAELRSMATMVTGAARPAIELRYTLDGAEAPKGAFNPHHPGSAAATWWQRGHDNPACVEDVAQGVSPRRA